MRPPAPPKHLRPASADWWRRVVRVYELGDHELVVLRLACEQLDRAAEAREAVEQDGAYVEGRFGVKQHPGLSQERNAVLTFSRLLRQLGLSEALEVPGSAGDLEVLR